MSTWGGTFDWGYFFFLAEVDRKSVVEFGQFPLWNPYYCGGAVHLANPQTYFLSPTFLLILIFGTPVGIRLTLTLATFLAFDGMRRLLRTLDISPAGGWVGGAGYAISGTLAHHLGGGHVGWVGFCVLPYVLHSFHKAMAGERRHILYGALLLAWIFGHFGGYTFPYSALALAIYGALWGVSRRRLRAAAVAICSIVTFALGTAAVRLLPILEFMRGHPRLRPDFDIVRPAEFAEIYAIRHRTRNVPGHPYVWPEYGNYLGPAAMVLIAGGAFLVMRKRKDLWPALAAMIIFLIFQVGNVPGFPWWLLKHLPIFRFMRAPSRFTILAGLFGCLLIGVAVDWLRRACTPEMAQRLWRTRITCGCGLVLVLTFLVDAASFNREQWFQTLTTPPPRDIPASSFHQTAGERRRMYAYPRMNRGSIDCFEETPLDISPRLQSNAAAEEYPLDPAHGTVRRIEWTPNRVVLQAVFDQPGTVVINQNYHGGWRLTGGVLANEGGLLAAKVESGQHTLTFRFLPTSFLVGAGLSLATLLYGVWLWARWAGNRHPPTR